MLWMLTCKGKNQFIHNFNDKIRGFEQKLLLWKNQLTANNVPHFKYLAKNALTSLKYVKYIDMLI
jgi:hypothetical protein